MLGIDKKIIVFLLIAFSARGAFAIPSADTLKWEEGYKDIYGTKLYYKTVGEGDSVMILHGGPGLNMSYFFPQMLELAKHHKLFFFDQRACGKSDAKIDSVAMSLTNMIDDVEEMRKAFGIDKLSLIGHSFGGLLAEHYAMKYPAHLEKLILVNPSSHHPQFTVIAADTQRKRFTTADSIERMGIMRTKEFQQGKSTAYEKIFRNTFKTTFYDKKYIDSLTLTLPEDFLARAKVPRYMQPDNWFYNLSSQLGSIQCPVLIVHGDYDPLPKRAIRDLSERILNSHVAEIEHCGHFPFVEQKKQFFFVVNNFLGVETN